MASGDDQAGGKVLANVPRALSRTATQAEGRRQAMPYEPACAVFRQYLHGQKLKFTPERAMILDAVLHQEGLFEAEGLTDGLKKRGFRVSRATVYRTLNHLQDAGLVRQVFFDNKQGYFEAVVGQERHDYLVCVETGRVVSFNSERLRKLRDEIARENGFEPLGHSFQVFGLSPEAGSRS
ncbi:MAG: Fur family transcriptional regulator [Phycisphaerae bacterium]